MEGVTLRKRGMKNYTKEEEEEKKNYCKGSVFPNPKFALVLTKGLQRMRQSQITSSLHCSSVGEASNN